MIDEKKYDGLSNYDLSKAADELLKAAGCDIFGQEKSKRQFEQSRFESKIQTGAFCSKSKNSRRR